MVQVIRRPPSFSEQLGQNLGHGIGQGLQTLLTGLMEMKQQKAARDYFKQLSEQHPDDPFYQQLSAAYESPLRSRDKLELTKSIISGRDPYRAEQQQRLSKDAISTQYHRAISELDNALKGGLYRFGSEEYEQAVDMRHRLAKERDQLLGFGLEEEPKEEDMLDKEEEIETTKPMKRLKKKIPKFNASNPQHRARRDQILKKTRGDRRKAGIVLSKEFEL